MASTVEITSNNFSGQQVTVVFTPKNSEISYGLGVKTIPFLFDSSIISNNIDVIGSYSINIINTNCTHILVIN
jgi:hypothetical protein